MKVIIVDDEIKACKNLEHILMSTSGQSIEILGVAPNTQIAEILINELQPDAVFLDIEMPEENAFSFLNRIAPINFEVVFVTAYDEFALTALKLNAVDYILKPISICEVENAVLKLEERLKFRQLVTKSKEQYDDLENQFFERRKATKIILKENNEVEVVPFKNIIFIEGKGSYSNVCFYNDIIMKTMLMGSHVAEYESLLPSESFFRIHKSYIVNGSFIEKLSTTNGIYAILKNGKALPVGRRRYADLLLFLKNSDFQ